jgi:single-stranded-DNA-specific exonuclease
MDAGLILPPTVPEAALGVARSLTGRRWVWHTLPDGTERAGLGLAQRLELPELLGQLLAARGIDADGAAAYLEPTLRALLPDPCALADMEAAAARIAAAVTRGETVGVFGDYDVDGACSAALMVSALRGLGCRVAYHVPDRLTEGYGPNEAALRGLVAQGAGCIVCVDCGSAGGAVFSALGGLVDVVVLDHHPCDAAPGGIVAVVNPNRPDCGSGLRSLCAAAVSFMTLVAVVRVLRRAGFFRDRKEPDLLALLDLVALATVCDVMPLTGLNRALVTQGLRVMARRSRAGLAALLDVAQVRGAPTAASLGFALGPRLNAAGRIDSADLSVRLLLCDDPAEARVLAERLDAINAQRRTVQAQILDQAMAAAQVQMREGRAVLVVAAAGWHAGIVGIVAGKLREQFNRPSCVAAVADGVARGSGRSAGTIDLGGAVHAARAAGLLLTGGGHAMAAGFSLPADGIEAFSAFLCERLAHANDAPAAPDLPVGGTLAMAHCTAEMAGHLARLAPFGNGNEEPILVVPRARVMRADRIGSERNAVRAFVQDESGFRLKAMLFRPSEGPLADSMLAARGAAMHLAGHLRAEAWNGAVTASLVVADAALA